MCHQSSPQRQAHGRCTTHVRLLKNHYMCSDSVWFALGAGSSSHNCCRNHRAQRRAGSHSLATCWLACQMRDVAFCPPPEAEVITRTRSDVNKVLLETLCSLNKRDGWRVGLSRATARLEAKMSTQTSGHLHCSLTCSPPGSSTGRLHAPDPHTKAKGQPGPHGRGP